MFRDKIELVDPVAEVPEKANIAACPIGDLNGKRLGFRTDHFWKSFDIFAQRIQERLTRKHPSAEIVGFQNLPNTGGSAVGPEVSPEFRSFSERIDAAILGLCA